jgi:glycine/D-amino acid oxidase-like deaminating enzyme
MTLPWPEREPSPQELRAFAGASTRPFWLEDLPARDPDPPLEGTAEADLCIVGGGFTGLWCALHAVRDTPGRRVVVLESRRCGEGASGRNGGFVEASLTHGYENGLARFPEEIETLERLGRANLAGLLADLARLDIEAEVERTGTIQVALEAHELPALRAAAASGTPGVRLLERDEMRAEVDSPTYLAGLESADDGALVHPGKLADGLRRAALAAGVQIHEHSPATGMRAEGPGVRVSTAAGAVLARGAVLATSAYPGLVPALGRYIAPVYDYVLMTEPLTSHQRELIGWRRRQGLSDGANQFHYYRQSRDGRILFGGYDAVYRFGGPVDDRLDDHTATFARLSQHFFTTFPQLEGLRFSHRWGGAIDTCSRFSVFFGSALGGRVVYAAGYTGLGVGASRWGAQVALDLLDGRATESTGLRFVRRRPLPFPPEPLRSGVIQLTRNRLAAADRNEGRRGLWLRALDRAGLGFDS